MPIPTADLLDKESQHNATSSRPQTESNNQNDSTRVGSSNPSDASQHSHLAEGDLVLSREEAERLYEERMEEEYAKREGGA